MTESMKATERSFQEGLNKFDCGILKDAWIKFFGLENLRGDTAVTIVRSVMEDIASCKKHPGQQSLEYIAVQEIVAAAILAEINAAVERLANGKAPHPAGAHVLSNFDSYVQSLSLEDMDLEELDRVEAAQKEQRKSATALLVKKQQEIALAEGESLDRAAFRSFVYHFIDIALATYVITKVGQARKEFPVRAYKASVLRELVSTLDPEALC